MADKDLSSLTAGSTLDGTELAYIVQGGNSRKITLAGILGVSHSQAWSSVTGTPTTLSGYGITDAQAKSTKLTAIAALSTTDGGFIVGDGSTWTVETGSTARSSLGLAIGTDVQAYNAALADIAGLAKTDGGVIIGDGTNFTLETGATLRSSIGLSIGSDVQAYDAALTSIAGLTLSSGDILYSTGSNAYTNLAKGSDGQVLSLVSGLPTWTSVTGTGDMIAAVYDPNGVGGNAFSQDSMVDGTTNKNYTATEQTKLAGIEALADVTDATNVAAAGAAMKANNGSDFADPVTTIANLKGGLSAASRTAMKSLFTAALAASIATIHLGETGRAGTFGVTSSDLSTTLLGSAIASTSVSGNIITKANHSLLLGDAVVVTSAVNGLSTNTLYWVIWLSSSTFSLATSYDNAVAGTAVSLTGTSATTVKRHLDPREGLFVCPTSDITGASGGFFRQANFLMAQPGRVNALWFGATGNGSTYDDGPLISAFRALGSGPLSISNINTYIGGVAYLPKGQYLVRPNKLDLTGITGLILEGDGARLNNSFIRAATSIIVDGTSTTTADWMIQVDTNNSRALQASQVAFEYKNSFAGDLIIGDAPGVHLDLCSFGSTTLSGTLPMTANSAIRLWQGHHYNITRCSFISAATHIIIDNATGANTHRWLIQGNSFYDCTTSFITVTSQDAWGLDITSNDFDPISTAPVDGIVMRGQGFSIRANNFAGSTLNVGPSASWVTVKSGQGEIVGNKLWSQVTPWAVIVEQGNVECRANTGQVVNGIKYGGASMATGGNNRWLHSGANTTDVCVSFEQTSNGFVEWDMDDCGAGFGYSYSCSAALASSEGKINYNKFQDGSTNGPLFTTDAIKLSVRPGQRASKTTNYTITLKDWGWTFDNIGATGTITFTLPDCVQGFEVSIVRYADQNITIQRAGSDNILAGGTSAVTSISHTTASSLGATVTMRGFLAASWIKQAATGGW